MFLNLWQMNGHNLGITTFGLNGWVDYLYLASIVADISECSKHSIFTLRSMWLGRLSPLPTLSCTGLISIRTLEKIESKILCCNLADFDGLCWTPKFLPGWHPSEGLSTFGFRKPRWTGDIPAFYLVEGKRDQVDAFRNTFEYFGVYPSCNTVHVGLHVSKEHGLRMSLQCTGLTMLGLTCWKLEFWLN